MHPSSRLLLPALLFALLGALPGALPAHAYEIYTQDMEDAYQTSQSTHAPCTNPGYFSDPLIYSYSLCLICQKSISEAKKKVEDYRSIVSRSREAEAEAEAANRRAAEQAAQTQQNTASNAGKAQKGSSVGERRKAEDAGQLRDKAKSCKDTVDCKGNIAPEDLKAGATEKDACDTLAQGASKTHDEKSSNAQRMDTLEAKDSKIVSNLGGGEAGIFGVTVAAATVAAAVAVQESLKLKAESDSIKAALNDLPSLAGGGVESWLAKHSAKVKAKEADAAAKNAAPVNSEGTFKNQAAPVAGLTGDSKRNGFFESSTASRNARASPEAAESGANPDFLNSQAGNAYSDPLLAFLSTTSDGRLVSRLRNNSALRAKVKQQIAEMEARIAKGSLDPRAEEFVDYYKKAVVEAESNLREGSLEQLAPLEAKEVFGMESEETEREIHRMTASMHSALSGEAYELSLFPRVRQAIGRQVANGKLSRKKK